MSNSKPVPIGFSRWNNHAFTVMGITLALMMGTVTGMIVAEAIGEIEGLITAFVYAFLFYASTVMRLPNHEK